MKRATIAVMACGAMLGFGVPTASAAVAQTVYKCEGTATWQVTIDFAGQSYADRTLTGQCKNVRAAVQDDGNFSIQSFDSSGSTATFTLNLTGAGVTGAPVFVGVATSSGSGTLRGPVTIAGPETLNASIVATDSSPLIATEVHTGAGSCGPSCYRTNVVWTGTRSG